MPNVDFSFPKKFPLNLIGSPKKDKDRRMFEEYTEDTCLSAWMDGKHSSGTTIQELFNSSR